MEQSDIRRRLNFTNLDEDMPSPSSSPREGGERNPTLSRRSSTEESLTSIDFGETDEEWSSSGDEEGDDPPGYRLLYEGPGHTVRVRRPREGQAIIIGRYEGGFTRVARVPVFSVHIAMPRQETQENGNTPRNEINDRQGE